MLDPSPDKRPRWPVLGFISGGRPKAIGEPGKAAWPSGQSASAKPLTSCSPKNDGSALNSRRWRPSRSPSANAHHQPEFSARYPPIGTPGYLVAPLPPQQQFLMRG
jgi:hypothetical protein